MSDLPPASRLGPVRRLVTGHTEDGRAVTVDDNPRELRAITDDPTFFTDVLFWTDNVPVDNAAGSFTDLSVQHARELSSPGSMFRAVDFAPGCQTVFHRTITLDYAIVMAGTITLVLDDNKRTTLKAGDVIMQRGTIHAWLNEGTEWTRVYFILLAANKVRIGNTKLETEYRPL